MTPYYLKLHHGSGIGVRAALNDLPFYSTKGEENNTATMPCNHLLLPGENVLVIELFAVPRPSFAPFIVGPMNFALFTDDEARRTVHHMEWPDDWEAAETAAQKAKQAPPPEGEEPPPINLAPPPLPYLHVSRFLVDEENARSIYVGAPRASFGPEGLPEQHDAVRRIYRAFQSGDADIFLEEHALKLEERQRAYPTNPSFTLAKQHASVADHFSKPWQVRPTEMKELHFDSRAGGRVAHVTRVEDGYALEAVSEDAEDNYFATNLFLTLHNGAWRVFR